MNKGKVLFAMSGGVDSTVGAVMLKKQGYDIIGITMKTWAHNPEDVKSGKEVGCCTVESMNDARQVAVRHGFKHFIVDIRDEFGAFVIDRFVDDYVSGRTPNPCVLCNTHIKWAALLRRADDLGCDFIATGHYANLREENGRYVISKGKDHSKDQSYALWGVSQKHLARTIFPLGSYHKTEIRDMATDWGLLNVADKPDSYEICFIPDNNYHRFIKESGRLTGDLSGGSIINSDGAKIGEHEGYYKFTIGQRRGINIPNTEPLYVTHIEPTTNTITVGEKSELVSYDCIVDEVNMVKYDSIPTEKYEAISKIRYNDDGTSSEITQVSDTELHVHFPVGRDAITPGQALVSYEGDDVVSGGWIRKINVTI